jgi:DNA-binding response OmpR family regulator
MARLLDPDLMVMAADLEGESGWLTCEKVRREAAQVRVFLIGDAAERRNHAFAAFVGAVAFLDRGDSIQTLVQEVCGRELPAAG